MSKRLVIATYPPNMEAFFRETWDKANPPEFELAYLPQVLPAGLRNVYSEASREALLEVNRHYTPEFMRRLPEAEIIFGFQLPVDVLQRAPKLKWIANVGSGTDQYRALGLGGSGVTLTSAKGVAARTVAEYAITALLALSKRLPAHFAQQSRGEWKKLGHSDLDGRTLGIVGLGEIGREVARMAKAFGMRVVATKRTHAARPPANVDVLYPAAELDRMLAECDAVIVAVALSAATRNLLGRAQLATMKKGAWLVNVARGAVLDEAALFDALQAGHLGGAACDVFVEEPLPAASPLWGAPNLIITPHTGNSMDNYYDALFGRFLTELERYARGEPLRWVVDLELGY